jgi:hypothetical protein
VDCLGQADGRNTETQLEERRDNAACVGEEEGNGNVVDAEEMCADGGESASLRQGGRGTRIFTGG